MIKFFKTEEEWLEAKKTTIGGTGISSVINMNDYQSALQYYMIKKGIKSEEINTEHTRRGIILEPAILNWFKLDMNATSLYEKAVVGIPFFSHPDNDRLTSSPDDMCELDGFNGYGKYIIEAKSTIKPVHEFDDVSRQWLCQLNWNIGLALLNGLDVIGGYFTVLVGTGLKNIIFPYEFNQDFFDMQVKAGTAFLDLLDNGVEPPPHTQEDFNSIETIDGKVVYATIKHVEYAQKLKALLKDEEELNKSIEYYKLQIRRAMGSAEYLYYEPSSSDTIKIAAYKWAKRTTVNSSKLETEFPDVFDKVKKINSYRQLRVNYGNI